MFVTPHNDHRFTGWITYVIGLRWVSAVCAVHTAWDGPSMPPLLNMRKKVKRKTKRKNIPKMGYEHAAINLRSENECGEKSGRQGLDMRCRTMCSTDSCQQSAPQTD